MSTAELHSNWRTDGFLSQVGTAAHSPYVSVPWFILGISSMIATFASDEYRNVALVGCAITILVGLGIFFLVSLYPDKAERTYCASRAKSYEQYFEEERLNEIRSAVKERVSRAINRHRPCVPRIKRV